MRHWEEISRVKLVETFLVDLEMDESPTVDLMEVVGEYPLPSLSRQMLSSSCSFQDNLTKY